MPRKRVVAAAAADVGSLSPSSSSPSLFSRRGKQSKASVSSRERPTRWTSEEKERLRQAVKLYGLKEWKRIAEFVGTKDHKAAYQHWRRVLDPSLRKVAFSNEELLRLADAIRREGLHRWVKVAEMVGKRSDTHCRARWNVIKKSSKKFDKDLVALSMGQKTMKEVQESYEKSHNDHPNSGSVKEVRKIDDIPATKQTAEENMEETSRKESEQIVRDPDCGGADDDAEMLDQDCNCPACRDVESEERKTSSDIGILESKPFVSPFGWEEDDFVEYPVDQFMMADQGMSTHFLSFGSSGITASQPLPFHLKLDLQSVQESMFSGNGIYGSGLGW